MAFAKVEEWYAGETCRLSNGIRIWARQLERCDHYYLALGVPTGSECDPKSEEGTAHFLEHVTFRGGQRFSSSRHLKEHLTAWGNFPRGVTSRQFTSYELVVPPELVLRGLEVLSSLLFDVEFRGLELERSIIQQEMGNRLNHLPQVKPEAIDAALNDHPHWQALTIGTVNSLKMISDDTLRRFHKRWYNTSDVYGVIIGPREESLLLEIMTNALATIPKQASRQSELPQPPTIQPGSSIRHWGEWGANFNMAVVAYGVALPPDVRMKQTAKIVAKVLEDDLGSPLFEALREDTGLVYTCNMSVESFRGFDQLCFQATVEPRRVSDVMRAFERCVQDEHHYTSVLSRVAKRKLMEALSDRPSLTNLGRTKLMAMLEQHPDIGLNDDLSHLDKIGPDDLIAFVRQFLRPEQWRAVQILPNA